MADQQPDRAAQAAAAAAAAETALIALWAGMQASLLAAFTRILAATPPTRLGWQHALPQLRAVTRAAVGRLTAQTPPLIGQLLDAVQQEATASATAAVHDALSTGSVSTDLHLIPGSTPWHEHTTPAPPPPAPPTPPTGSGLEAGGADFFNLSEGHGARADRFIRQELSGSFDAQLQRITRLPDDVFRQVGARGARAAVLDNGATLRQAQAAAWQTFAQRGITSFTDVSGRQWSMATYTEMAVRTAAARAFNESHLARMRALGCRYFTVPEHATSCPLCTPWQGAVLSDGLTDDPNVHVDGTVNDAIHAGLFHPQCRHTLLPYFPATMPRPQRTAWTAEREREWRDVQRQRELERRIRKAREALETALTPQQAAHAKRVVAVTRQQLRAFLASRPYLSRQYEREQPHLGYPKVRLPQGPAGPAVAATA